MSQAVALRNLIDKQAIAQVLATHSRGVDRADFPLLRSAYHDDANVSYGFFVGPALDFCRILADAQKQSPVTLHRTSNVWIALNGDTAVSESYVIAYLESPEDGASTQRIIGGRYLDRHRRTDGQWRIAHRTYVMDWNLNWPSTAAWPEADPDHFGPRGGQGMSDPGRTLLTDWKAGFALQQKNEGKGLRMSAADAEIDRALSKQAIHEVLTAMCRSVDRCDEQLMRSVCHPDATFVIGSINGPLDEFAPGVIDMIRTNLTSCFHSIGNEWVEVSGDQAVAETYVIAVACAGAGKDATQSIHGGRYLDRFERRDGTWKLARRVYVEDYNINQPSTAMDDGMYETLKTRGGRKPDDPLYAFWPQ